MISRKAYNVRKRMVAYANFLTGRARLGRMPYEEFRAMRSFPTVYMHVPKHPTDCSESTSIIAEASGAPTPYVVNGAGYTGTMLDKLPHIRKLHSRRGDFVVFGGGTGEHVVMLLQRGLTHRDPLVWSHGRPGVDVMPLSHMKAGFPGQPVTFLRSVPHNL